MRAMAGLAVVLVVVAARPVAAADYAAGLRFDDGTDLKKLQLGESATLELFVSTSDANALMKEFFIGFSHSLVSDGGTTDGLLFGSDQNSLVNWDYSSSQLGGPLTNRFLTAAANLPVDDISGPFTELVVDSIEITVLTEGTYTLAPDPQFDVIIADRDDPAPGNSLDPVFGSVTIVVPEPSSLSLLAATLLLGTRRRF